MVLTQERGFQLLKKIFPVSFSKLPLTIKIIGLFYLLTPVFSYLWTAYAQGIPFWKFSILINLFQIPALLLNIVGFLLGIGILGVKRWGYFLFLGFNLYLVGHGLHLIYQGGFTKQFIWNLFITLLPFFLNMYFLNKEISTPYLTLIPRGFRKKWRIEIPILGQIQVSEKEIYSMKTMDISPTGFLATVEGNIETGTQVKVKMNLDSQWIAPAEMMRVEDGKFGFKFLYLPGDKNFRDLDKFLSTKLLPRFSTHIPVELSLDGEVYKSEILNISEKGFYFSTDKGFEVGIFPFYKFSLYGYTFTGKGKVSWENKSGNFEKPPGYGISFEEPNSYLLYKVFVYVYSILHTINVRDR
jgi:hypothetical protein